MSWTCAGEIAALYARIEQMPPAEQRTAGMLSVALLAERFTSEGVGGWTCCFATREWRAVFEHAADDVSVTEAPNVARALVAVVRHMCNNDRDVYCAPSMRDALCRLAEKVQTPEPRQDVAESLALLGNPDVDRHASFVTYDVRDALVKLAEAPRQTDGSCEWVAKAVQIMIDASRLRAGVMWSVGMCNGLLNLARRATSVNTRGLVCLAVTGLALWRGGRHRLRCAAMRNALISFVPPLRGFDYDAGDFTICVDVIRALCAIAADPLPDSESLFTPAVTSALARMARCGTPFLCVGLQWLFEVITQGAVVDADVHDVQALHAALVELVRHSLTRESTAHAIAAMRNVTAQLPAARAVFASEAVRNALRMHLSVTGGCVRNEIVTTLHAWRAVTPFMGMCGGVFLHEFVLGCNGPYGTGSLMTEIGIVEAIVSACAQGGHREPGTPALAGLMSTAMRDLTHATAVATIDSINHAVLWPAGVTSEANASPGAARLARPVEGEEEPFPIPAPALASSMPASPNASPAPAEEQSCADSGAVQALLETADRAQRGAGAPVSGRLTCAVCDNSFAQECVRLLWLQPLQMPPVLYCGGNHGDCMYTMCQSCLTRWAEVRDTATCPACRAPPCYAPQWRAIREALAVPVPCAKCGDTHTLRECIERADAPCGKRVRVWGAHRL